MGEVRALLKLRNSVKPECQMSVDAIADTGALVNWLPQAIVDALELQPVGSLRVQFADGREEKRVVYGPITLDIDGRVAIVDAVAGADGTEPLLGVVALERLDLLVDPLDQKLKPRHPQYPEPLLAVRNASTLAISQ